ncbi:MAG: hypothetical protein K6T73_03345 [Candidatus Bathyarchaeota archaeon]|nr:hypothetical protein [Candidatus Bathyarchaeota archaeon]
MVFKEVGKIAKKEGFLPDNTWIICGCKVRERGEKKLAESQCLCFLTDTASIDAAKSYLKTFGFVEIEELKKLFIEYI